MELPEEFVDRMIGSILLFHHVDCIDFRKWHDHVPNRSQIGGDHKQMVSYWLGIDECKVSLNARPLLSLWSI